MKPKRPFTYQDLEAAKAKILSETTITRWAQDKGVFPAIAYQFFNGRLSGMSGESRRVAIAAGLIPSDE